MKLYPFRPLRYQTARAGPLRDLVSPPYDVIGAGDRRELTRRNPYNVVRLILPSGGRNRYRFASSLLERWCRDGILRRDPRPGFFPAVQEFRLPGGDLRSRLGFFAVLGTAGENPQESVLPHEGTFPGPRRDRMRMLQACHADLEPILLLYSDPAGRVPEILREGMRGRPLASFREPDGLHHRLWKLGGVEEVEEIRQAMLRKKPVIADGHHRFGSSVDFWSRFTNRDGGSSPGMVAGILAFFCRAEDPGVVSLPTHRCVSGITENRLRQFLPWLRRRFTVVALFPHSAGEGGRVRNRFLRILGEAPPPRFSFGLRIRGVPGYFLVCSRKSGGRREPGVRPGVAILEGSVLDGYLGLPPSSSRRSSRVTYHREATEALEAVERGRSQLALLLRPIAPRQLLDAARRGELLPPKSTYFFPKLPSGLLFRPFQE